MAMLFHEDDEMRATLGRTVRARWPRESLVFMTNCDAERRSTTGGVPDELEPMAIPEPSVSGGHRAGGLLALTQARMIFHGKRTPTLAVRAVAIALAGLALMNLLFGGGVLPSFLCACAGLGAWAVAKVLNVYLATGSYVPFEGIRHIDAIAQRLQGLGHGGVLFDLRIPDSSDFQMVVSLVRNLGSASPA
jgi:hypothetical protein